MPQGDHNQLSGDSLAVLRMAFTRPEWSLDALLREAERASISEPGLHAAVSALVQGGLLAHNPDDPTVVRARDPRTVLGPTLAAEQQKLSAMQAGIDDLTALLSSLYKEYVRTRDVVADWESERLDGVEAVRARLEELAAGAREEACALIPLGAQDLEVMEASQRSTTMR